MFMMDFLMMSVGVLISVAFITLFERKILGYVNIRKGPSKATPMGLSQPFSDAMKLFFKEFKKPEKLSFLMFTSGPMLSMMTMILLWSFFPSFFFINMCWMAVLMIASILSLSVYFIIMCGMGSNSIYSTIGCYRSISQTISYEISMIMFTLCIVCIVSSYQLFTFSSYQNSMWFLFMSPLMILLWMFLTLSETNRAPFDFSEGESELVSGFNVEYGGVMFSLIFISEYGMIMFISLLTSIFLLSGNNLAMKMIILSMTMFWIRGTFPRARYDMLMEISWKFILPIVLFMITFFFMVF